MNGIQEKHEAKVRELEFEMMKWVTGDRTHWNYYVTACAGDPAKASAMCSVADASEVQKLSLAIQALNSRRTF